MKKLLIELVFACVGIPVFVVLFVVGFFYTFFKHLFSWDYSLSKQTLPLIRSVTLAFDGLANAGAGELLNDVYKPIIKYGKWYQTISAVTGLNYENGKDSKLRVFLDKILGKNHCTDAITEMERDYYIKYLKNEKKL